MGIKLYNSLSGRKEPLETIEPGKVRFYACGPTVYNLFHIGNGRMFVVFDTVRRYLEYRGYEVKFVQNFTDVDDKIIARANETGDDVRGVADKYISAYFEDADALGVRRAVIHPRVTESIPQIIEFVQDLVSSGHAYERHGNVYFDTSAFETYGKLSNQSMDDLRSGFRIDVNEDKNDPTDFALWKAVKPGEEYWESPWGGGRPGWHIECSVMNLMHLGAQIDIHAGGRDLIFPHHENEIAQSEAHSGRQFARYWMHNGTLNINGEKMSKSTGNFIMTRDLLQRRNAKVIRYFLLSAQYRHPLNYTEESIDAAEQALSRIDRCLRNIEHRLQALSDVPDYLAVANPAIGDSEDVVKLTESVRRAFVEAMDDDFNSADGISAVFEGVRLANVYLTRSFVSRQGLELWALVIHELLGVLGLQSPSHRSGLTDKDVEVKIAMRMQARRARDFALSDSIRDELAKLGITVEDTAQGMRWYRV